VRCLRFFGALVFLSALTLPAAVKAQLSQSSSANNAIPAIGKIIVRVRGTGGASMAGFASIRLYSNFSSFSQTAASLDSSQAVFTGVPVGEYQVEVRATGFKDAIGYAIMILILLVAPAGLFGRRVHR